MTTTPDLDTLHTYTRFASAIPPRRIYVNAKGDGADPHAYGHHCPYGKWPMFLRFFFQYSFSKSEYEKEIAADPARWRYVVFACLDGHGWLVLEKADTDDSEAPTTLTATGKEMAGRAGRPVQMIPEMEHAQARERARQAREADTPAVEQAAGEEVSAAAGVAELSGGAELNPDIMRELDSRDAAKQSSDLGFSR